MDHNCNLPLPDKPETHTDTLQMGSIPMFGFQVTVKKGTQLSVTIMQSTVATMTVSMCREQSPRALNSEPQTMLPRLIAITQPRDYLEGQGDLVSRLMTPITHIVTLLILIISLLIKSP